MLKEVLGIEFDDFCVLFSQNLKTCTNRMLKKIETESVLKASFSISAHVGYLWLMKHETEVMQIAVKSHQTYAFYENVYCFYKCEFNGSYHCTPFLRHNFNRGYPHCNITGFAFRVVGYKVQGLNGNR